MKKIIPILILFLAPFIGFAQTDTTTLVKTGDQAPEFEFSLSKTKTAHLSDYKGKIILIDFWATW